MNKKIISISLAALMTVCNFKVLDTVFADNIQSNIIKKGNSILNSNDERRIKSGYFTYGDYECYAYNSEVTITKYNGKKTNLSVVGKIDGMNVVAIDTHAFSWCESLENVELPDSIETIGQEAFLECKSLKSIKLSRNLKTIEYALFQGCKSLKKVEVFDKVKNVEGYAFDGCPENLVIYGYKNSYIEKYAKDKKIYFEILPMSNTPEKITGLKQVSNTTSSIKLSWTKETSVTGYQVYRATSKNGTYSKVSSVTSTNYYNNSNLSSGKTYYYKVRAYKKVGTKYYYGAYSDILTASTKCIAPTVTVTSPKTKTAKVSWNKVTNASGYEVYRATSKTGTYSLKKTVTSSSTLSYTNTGLTKGKTYYYKVRAYKTVNNQKVYSNYSTIKSVKVK